MRQSLFSGRLVDVDDLVKSSVSFHKVLLTRTLDRPLVDVFLRRTLT